MAWHLECMSLLLVAVVPIAGVLAVLWLCRCIIYDCLVAVGFFVPPAACCLPHAAWHLPLATCWQLCSALPSADLSERSMRRLSHASVRGRTTKSAAIRCDWYPLHLHRFKRTLSAAGQLEMARSAAALTQLLNHFIGQPDKLRFTRDARCPMPAVYTRLHTHTRTYKQLINCSPLAYGKHKDLPWIQLPTRRA